MGLHSEARLDHKMMLLIKQLNLYLNHFPKHEKYGLCQQIRNAAYDVYGLIVEAQICLSSRGNKKQAGIYRFVSGPCQKNRLIENHVVLYQE